MRKNRLLRTVQTEYFGKDQDEDHTDEQTGLLRRSSYTRITNDTNRESGRKPRETDGETRTELDDAGEERHDHGHCV